MATHRKRRRSITIFCLLLSFGALGEAKIPQHRVKRGERVVEYEKIISNDSRRKFWIPDSLKNGATLLPRMHSSRNSLKESSTVGLEVLGENFFWHLHVDAGRLSQTHSRSLFNSFVGINASRPGSAEDDPYQGSITGVDEKNQTWNVSTEVQYGDITSSTNTSSSSEIYSTSEMEGNTTIATHPFQPLRIRAILSGNDNSAQYVNETQRTYLFENILSPAILAWSAALRVNPVVGNLTVDKSQLSDGVSCGPGLNSGHPSVLVPSEHLSIGLPDTDFVVYLSLSFYGNAASPTSAPTDDLDQSTLELDNLATETALNYSFHENMKDLYCTGDYLAAATYCSTDQNDRPTAAFMHLCMGNDFFNEQQLKRNIVIVMHELGHVLGFNPQSMAHFRRSDGSPITKRDKDGNVIEHQIECAGPREKRRFINVSLPSEDIIRFKSVRGGVRVAELVTPNVLQVVRNHFDCQHLSGAELESGHLILSDEETPASCIGDHWERRLFRTDLMNPIVDEVPFSLRISPITLALFADSGWYQVDLSRTAYVEGWGRGAGCPFVNDECISPNGNIPISNEPFFCNKVADTMSRGSRALIQGCSPDMVRKAICSMAQYDTELPSAYQYFNGTWGANVGGNEPLLDYCPVYSGFSDGDCQNDSNQHAVLVSRIEEFGRKNSRCLIGESYGLRTGLCLPIACVIEDRSLRIRIDGIWNVCKYSGQAFKSGDDKGTIVHCPDVIRTCPTFYCDRDCLGTGGSCDYGTGTCVCPRDDGNMTLDACEDTHKNPSGFFYEDELLESNESTPLLLDTSPLDDYYVPNERVLKNRRRRILRTPYLASTILVSLLGIIAAIFSFQYRRNDIFRKRVNTGWDSFTRFLFRRGPDDEVESYQPSPRNLPFRVNKDKFVAHMLLDLRVHHPQLNDQQSIPDTSAETDSNANFTRSDIDECASDSCFSDISSGPPVAELPDELLHPSQIRRRFIRDLV